MKKSILHTALLAAGLIAALGGTATVQAHEKEGVQHALLISVDGLHALDVANYVQSHPTSALAELARHGVTYSVARTPENSDSFPGLLALVTGGTSVSHGLFYDVSYDRSYFANGDSTCSGTVGGSAPGTISKAGPGSTIAFDETIDKYDTSVPGNFVSKNVIDPTALPYRLTAGGKCVPVFPHDAIKSNTIFEVVKAHGGRTAWADKHPAYDLVNGPSGHGVDDLYTPEITNVGGLDNTVSVVCTSQNDELKVQGILNQIHGRTHDGKPASVPAVFGMNFQSVSVGQKLAADNASGDCKSDTGSLVGQPGGYLDGAGTPTAVLQYGLDYADEALARMIQALKDEGLYESTLFVVSAKHGQSPINPVKVNKPGHFADLVAAIKPVGAAEVAGQAALNVAAGCNNGPCGFVQDDDIALIWLQDQSQTASAAAFINHHAKELFVDEVLAGNEIKLKFNDPATDKRTPDILVQPQYGVIYTTSKQKNAEHGGFSFGDTNVGLIVSNPALSATVIKTPVTTAQVPVTILQALGIDPGELKAVQIEHTEPLPGLTPSRED